MSCKNEEHFFYHHWSVAMKSNKIISGATTFCCLVTMKMCIFLVEIVFLNLTNQTTLVVLILFSTKTTES